MQIKRSVNAEAVDFIIFLDDFSPFDISLNSLYIEISDMLYSRFENVHCSHIKGAIGQTADISIIS